MGNPIYVTLTSTGTSRVVNLDRLQSPFNAFVAVTGSSSGTFTYGVEYTLLDQQYLTSIGSTLAITWIADTNLAAGTTVSGVTSYGFPVAGVRCTVTAISSAALVLQVLQGMGA